ncbi:MAG: hypothetical protein M3Q36_02435 [bacterium]|nr:hypothetical protein [bacterium]
MIVLIILTAYVILAVATSIWYLATFATRNVKQSTNTLATYKNTTQSVLSTSKLRVVK